MTHFADQFEEDHPVIASVYGLGRWNAAAVADAVRRQALSKAEAAGLANLIEGRHPQGLRLEIVGQGKGWMPATDKAKRWDRLIRVGKFVEGLIADGATWEEAVFDAEDHFGLSAPTVARDLRLYRLSKESD